MHKMIQRIIEIEDMAQEVVAEAKKNMSEHESIIKEHIEKRQSEIMEEINRETALRIKENDAAHEEKIRKIQKDSEAKMSRLNAKFSENKTSWENSLFNNIINS